MRHLYSLLAYLLTPALLVYFAIRGIADHGWWARWTERFGNFDATGQMRGIVIHAASVGEVNAAASLIRALQQRWPAFPVTVTCFTPTGSNRVRSSFANSVHHVFAPIDLPGATRRFLQTLEPRLLIVMETEIWPNLFHQAHTRNVPIMISNARLTQRSADGWSRFRRLAESALQCASLIAAQTDEDMRRFTDLGANKDTTRTFGNLKFDLVLPFDLSGRGQRLRKKWGPERTVLVAGSTHETDERALFKAFRSLLERDPQALLLRQA